MTETTHQTTAGEAGEYDPAAVELKWQTRWRERGTNVPFGIDSNERREQSTEALEQAIDVIDPVADEVQVNLERRLA